MSKPDRVPEPVEAGGMRLEPSVTFIDKLVVWKTSGNHSWRGWVSLARAILEREDGQRPRCDDCGAPNAMAEGDLFLCDKHADPER